MATWYRGESTNAPPMKAGGAEHDLGDGMYLTDSLESAKAYGNMRVQDSGGSLRVSQIDVKGGEFGRVLDLRNDRNFQLYLAESAVPQPGYPSRRDLMRQAPENYGKFFQSYLSSRKINIENYDAVIGPDLLRGGNQVCLRHRNGQPSQVAQSVRSQLQPMGARPPGGGASLGQPRKGIFSSGAIVGLANALEAFQRWAEGKRQLDAAIEAWNNVMEREAEVVRAQAKYPDYPVYVMMVWRVGNKFNPHLYKSWEVEKARIFYGGAKPSVNSDIGGLKEQGYEGYLLPIPALKAREQKALPAQAPTWRDGLTTVYGKLKGDRSQGGNAQDALRTLNSYPMYSILPILKEIKRVDHPKYDLLEQAMYWAFTGVNVPRFEAAFMAVRMSENNGDSFVPYKAACSQFSLLPPDQQKDIEIFMSGPAPAVETTITSPAGEWKVKAKHYVWIYKFDAKGAVTWRDPYAGLDGRGKYQLGAKKMTITWVGTKTIDEWDVPLNPTQQTGWVLSVEGKLALSATRT